MATDLGNDPVSSLQSTANPAPTTLSSGKVADIVLQDAATNSAPNVLVLEHGTSGTPVGNGGLPTLAFGGRIQMNLDDTVNAKIAAAAIQWFWRGVGVGAANNAGALSVFLNTAGTGTLGEVLRIQDNGSLSVLGGSVTTPGYNTLNDNRHGMGLDGGNRLFLGHTSVECLSVDGSAGAKIGFLGKVAAPAAAQTGGALTAGAAYTANEQSMIQKAYDCLRTFGLLT
jgi:hypothetical protein